MTYLKPVAIIALHYLGKADHLSYAQLESRLDINRPEALNLAESLHQLGLVEYLVSGIAITQAGKRALKIGWVE